MKKIIFIIFCLISLNLSAQDVIKVMQYNLMYYGKDVYDCTQTNNSINDKTEYLKTIITYKQPDIFTVNEIDVSTTDQTYLLNNVFINNGFPQFLRGTTSGSYSGNQIYYNSDKLTLYDQDYIDANPAITDVYKFRYNSPDAEVVELWCFVAHLKAGSTESDAQDRADATNNVMATINAVYGAGNYLFMGDLNLYTSTETAYQNLINYSNSTLRFYDPINTPGDWNNNCSYAAVHTQSTHTDSDGCPSTGGMDDRFDFILISNNIKNNLNKISYKSNTYKAVGNDSYHCNDALTDGTNTSVPSTVLNALYNNSDHIPVYLELNINQTPAAINEFSVYSLDVEINNPVTDELYFTIYLNNILKDKNFNVEIYDLLGKKVFETIIEKQQNTIEYEVSVSDFKSGVYIFRIYDSENNFYQEKFIKL